MKRILSWPPTITFGFLCFLLLLITKLQVAAPQGSNATRSEKGCRLRVTLRDAATGHPIPARIYLTDKKGESKTPSGVIAYSKKEEQHFIAPTQFQIELPAGRYTLVAERGAEYLTHSAAIELHAGEERNETILMRRWIDMNALGWFSGDLHNHRKVEEMPALLLAEDLNLAPTLADWIWEDRPRSEPPRTSDAFRTVDATHVYSVLDKEVERLENGPGAVDLLALKSVIPFDGYRLYPSNLVYCQAAHAQGGYVDAEKILWRDVAALVALRQIDFAGIVHNHFNRHGVELETDKWGMIPKYRPEFNTPAGMALWSMDVYYHFLNCGFHLPVSAGSASGVKASPLGHNRVYANVNGSFSYRNWFEALKAGRSFATNGPMLFFTVNGAGAGATVQAGTEDESKRPTRLRQKNRSVQVRAEAVSCRPLDRLEIIFRGRTIKSADNKSDSRKLVIDFTTALPHSGWLAARCFERPDQTVRFAHTSPIYLEASSSASARNDARFFMDWIDRALDFYSNEQSFRDPRHRQEMLSFFSKARSVYSTIAQTSEGPKGRY